MCLPNKRPSVTFKVELISFLHDIFITKRGRYMLSITRIRTLPLNPVLYYRIF